MFHHYRKVVALTYAFRHKDGQFDQDSDLSENYILLFLALTSKTVLVVDLQHTKPKLSSKRTDKTTGKVLPFSKLCVP